MENWWDGTGITTALESIVANGNLIGDASLGNLAVASKINVSSGSTAGNAGIVFTNTAYSGALVEERGSTTARYGIGAYGANTRVYAGNASTDAVRLSFATGESTFVDGLTVTRNGSVLANVGINTSAPQAALHVVGNTRVDGNLVTSADATASRLFAGNASVTTRLDILNGSATGNAGIVFTNMAYSGALIEERGSATARYGIGAYGANTRVYAGNASTDIVRLSFATGESTFVDGLTVTRDGSALANVGINTSAPQAALHVVGNARVDGTVYCSGDVTAFSDRRLKADLVPIQGALDKVDKLQGYTFLRTDTTDPHKRYAGLIAQEVMDVLPEAVYDTSEGTLSVSYGSVLGLLVNAVRELQAQVTQLSQPSVGTGG